MRNKVMRLSMFLVAGLITAMTFTGTAIASAQQAIPGASSADPTVSPTSSPSAATTSVDVLKRLYGHPGTQSPSRAALRLPVDHHSCAWASFDDLWINYGNGSIFNCEAFYGSGSIDANIQGALEYSTGTQSGSMDFTLSDGSRQTIYFGPNQSSAFPGSPVYLTTIRLN